MAGIALGAMVTAANAQNIDTTPSWNGTTFISSWGEPNTATYGQTITATQTQSRLTGFTFYLSQQSGVPPQFHAYVYEWNSATSRITGPALATSSVLTAPTTAAGTFVPVSVSFPGVSLTPGRQYVLMFTTSSIQPPNPALASYRYGSLGNNTAYPDGQFVFRNNGDNFDSLSTTQWSFINQDLAFIALLGPNLLALLLPNAAPINPTNVANALDSFVTTTNGSLPASFQPLYSLTPTQLQAALTQLDGEVHVDARQSATTMMNSFLSVMLNPFADTRAGVFGPALGFAPDREEVLPPEIASAYAGVLKAPPKLSTPGRYNVWGAGFGGSNRLDGDPVRVGSSDVRTSAGGFAAGIDYRVTANTLIGVAVSGGATKWELSNGLGSGKSEVFQIGGYSSTEFGPAYVSTAFAYGYHNMSTSRTAPLVGPDTLSADFNAWNIGGRIEAGFRIAAPVNFTPYLALQAQNFHAPSYLETSTTGGPGVALAVASQNAFALRGEVGTWFSKSFVIDPAGSTLGWFGRVAYAHDHHDSRNITAVFQSVPGSFFIVNGAEPARSLALVTAGLEARFANNIAISARFDGEFSNRSDSYSGTAKLRYSW